MNYCPERTLIPTQVTVSFIILAVAIVYVIQLPVAWWLVFIIFLPPFLALIIPAVYMVHALKIPLSNFCDIIKYNISFDFLIDRKLGVCRDYAKLSAALLFNIYPQKEIHFVYAPHHVSTGIKVEDKLYILDKYLPVTTFRKWNEKWKKGKFAKKTVTRAIEGRMFPVEDRDSVLPKTNQTEPDHCIPSSKKLEQLMGIQSPTDYSRDNPLKIWKWKDGAKLYEDDEIINYSIARRLKSIISREMLDKNQIAHIEINREKYDLIFSVYEVNHA